MSGSDAALIGRSGELARLATAASRAREGRGSLTLVSGPAGIGKTSLVTEAAARLVGTFATSFVTVGRWSADAPLLPWARTLRSLQRAGLVDATALEPLIATLLGGSSGGDTVIASTRDRVAVFDDVVGALVGAAAERPLALFLDDVHRADITVLLLLEFLVDALRTAPLHLVVSYRSESAVGPVADVLSDLERTHEHLRLGGLDEAGLVGLVSTRLGLDVSGGDLRRRSGGNPLLALQWASSESIEAADLATLYAQRIESVSTRCRDVLKAAVVLGGDLDLAAAASLVVGTSSPSSSASVNAIVREAVDAGLVVREGSTLRYAHDLVHETIYADMAPSERKALHRKAFDALNADRSPARADTSEEIARHAVEGDVDGPVALDVLREAANRAHAASAYEQSCQWWLTVVDRLDPRDARGRVNALLALADAQAHAGNRGASRASVLRAADIAVELGPDAVAVTLLEIDSHNSAAHVDADVVARLEAALRTDLSPSTTVQVQARLARWLVFTDSSQRHRVLHDAAVANIERVEEPRARARALYHLGVVSAGTIPTEERAPLIDDVVGAAQAADDRQLELFAASLEIGHLLEAGRGRAYRDAVDRYEQRIETTGARSWRWHVLLLRSTIASLDGRFDEAERLLDEAVAKGPRHGQHELETVHVACLGGHLAMRGVYGTIADLIADSAVRYREFPIARCAPALALADAGRTAEAAASLDLLVAEGLCDRPTDYTWLAAMWTLAVTAAAVGDRKHREVARRALEPFFRSVARMSREGMGCAGLVPFALGSLAEADGDLDAARDSYAAAHRLAADLGAPVLAADAQFALARVDGDADNAQRMRERALAAAKAVGVDLPLHAPPRRHEARSAVAPALAPATRQSELTSNPVRALSAEPASLTRQGVEWQITYRGTSARVGHSVGMTYLARLLAEPAREVHVLDLTGTPRDYANDDLGPVLDDEAVRAYRRRLEALRAALDDADDRGDVAASEASQTEIDALTAQLSGAFGLGGKPRPTTATAERARFAVSKALRTAVRRVGDAHPGLGDHLLLHVQTGTFCTYRHDGVTWTIDGADG